MIRKLFSRLVDLFGLKECSTAKTNNFQVQHKLMGSIVWQRAEQASITCPKDHINLLRDSDKHINRVAWHFGIQQLRDVSMRGASLQAHISYGSCSNAVAYTLLTSLMSPAPCQLLQPPCSYSSDTYTLKVIKKIDELLAVALAEPLAKELLRSVYVVLSGICVCMADAESTVLWLFLSDTACPPFVKLEANDDSEFFYEGPMAALGCFSRNENEERLRSGTKRVSSINSIVGKGEQTDRTIDTALWHPLFLCGYQGFIEAKSEVPAVNCVNAFITFVDSTALKVQCVGPAVAEEEWTEEHTEAANQPERDRCLNTDTLSNQGKEINTALGMIFKAVLKTESPLIYFGCSADYTELKLCTELKALQRFTDTSLIDTTERKRKRASQRERERERERAHARKLERVKENEAERECALSSERAFFRSYLDSGSPRYTIRGTLSATFYRKTGGLFKSINEGLCGVCCLRARVHGDGKRELLNERNALMTAVSVFSAGQGADKSNEENVQRRKMDTIKGEPTPFANYHHHPTPPRRC
ncbi:hypothetical protein DNTS_021073 [Danionella cerebrum]|uniref:Uncharacterized protein n=1 Tax=Danionella cerebrum TaxID=2873325 RepID=A0A553Q276_9TELE|nr:hypothetical protein DNTS_021073 [Danionella translucida]